MHTRIKLQLVERFGGGKQGVQLLMCIFHQMRPCVNLHKHQDTLTLIAIG